MNFNDIGKGNQSNNSVFIPKNINTSIERLKTVVSQMKNNATSINSYSKRLIKAKGMFEDLKNAIQTKINSGTGDIDALKKQIDAKTQAMAVMNNQIGEKDTKIKEILSQQQELQNNIQNLKKIIQQNDTEKGEITEKIRILNESNTRLQESLANAPKKEEYEEYINRVKELDQENQSLKSQIGPLNNRIKDLENNLKEAQLALNNAGKQEIADLTRQLQDANTAKQQLQTELNKKVKQNETQKKVLDLINNRLENLNAAIFASDGRIKPELLADQSELEDVTSSLEAFITQLKGILGMTYANVTANDNSSSSGGKRKRTQRNRRRSRGRRTRRRTKKTRRGRSRRGGYQYGTIPMTKSSSNTTYSATTSSPGTTSSPMTTSSSGTSSTASYGNDDFGSGVSGKTYKKRRNGKKAVNTKRKNNKKRNCKKCNCRGKCRCKRRA